LLLLVGMAVALLRKKKQLPQRAGINVELSKVEPSLTVEAKDVLSAALDSRVSGARERAAEPEAEALAEDNTQQEAERLRALTATIAANDPYLASRVIRAWLRETTEQAPSGVEAA
jgi:hypothetical protein